MDIYLKKEFLQFTGSFKERGARNTLLMLTKEQQKKGVISASLGNHALGLSYHGYKLGIPVTVVMPIAAPMMKIQKCREYHANVIVRGEDMTEAKKIAMSMSKKLGIPYINGYDHPHIMAGQGTIGLEIHEQCPAPDAVVVPVGGGGLIAGIAVAIKTLSPHTKIIVSHLPLDLLSEVYHIFIFSGCRVRKMSQFLEGT
jgi:threonine dehydratase